MSRRPALPVLLIAVLLSFACAAEEAEQQTGIRDLQEAADPTPSNERVPRGADFEPIASERDVATTEVTLIEYRIEMPEELPAGRNRFIVTNAGEERHNFEIEGEGIEVKFPEELMPRQTREMTVDLRPGNYKVYCPVGDHAARGMQTELRVTQ